MIVILLQKYNKKDTYASIYVNYFTVIQYVKYHDVVPMRSACVLTRGSFLGGNNYQQLLNNFISFFSTLVSDKQRAQAYFVKTTEQELKYN